MHTFSAPDESYGARMKLFLSFPLKYGKLQSSKPLLPSSACFLCPVEKITVLIIGFVGRFWQSRSCPAITNPFQAQLAPSNRWNGFIFLLVCEWLSHFYATLVTLHGKYVTYKTCWHEFLFSFIALINGIAFCFQGGKTGIRFSGSLFLWLTYCQDVPW